MLDVEIATIDLAVTVDDALGCLTVAGRRCLDAGASTGGFTDVLLRAGASGVVCVDVGYGQLNWRLRQDPRLEVLDRTNVRDLDPTCSRDDVLETLERLARSIDENIEAPVTVDIVMTEVLEEGAASF